MTFLSRVLGFIRDMVAAFIFGASPGFDAFVLAFRIPNLLRRLFAEGAFSQAFVPVLSAQQTNPDQEEVQSFINKVAGNLSLVLLIVTLLGMVCAPWIIKIFAPGFEPFETREILAIDMLRITFPYIFFISMTAFAGGLLNSKGNFSIPALTPVLLNISLIFCSWFLASKLGVPEKALAWGVFVAGVLQFAFQIPFLKKYRVLPKPQVDWHDPNVRRVLMLMGPAVFGAAITQINLLIDSLFASFLPAGSISWLYYADRLLEFPLGVIGVGLATVVLPSMSRQHAKQQVDKFNQTFDWGLRSVLLIGLPAAIGLSFLAGPLIASLFKSGKFHDNDVIMTQQCLMAYSVAVLGIMTAKIISSAFYAQQDIKTPVRVSVIILFANIILDAILIQRFAHVGLAISTSISSVLQAFLLGWYWHKKNGFNLQSGWLAFASRITLAAIGLAAFLSFLSPEVNIWLEWSRFDRIINLFSLVIGGVLLYGIILLIVGARPRHLLSYSEI